MSKFRAKVITDFLEKSVSTFPNKTAVRFEDENYSYYQINSLSEKVKLFLLSNNTKKADIIAIALPNSPEFITTYFGTLKAGCICLLIPQNISDRSLSYQFSKTHPRFVIVNSTFEQKLLRIKEVKTKKLLFSEILNFENNEKPIREPKVRPNDISTIIFTSGTTSEPKGAVLRHKNVVAATKNITKFLKWKSSDRDVNISQLTHSFGLGNIHCAFAAGATTILFKDTINLRKILNSIIESRATTFSAPPPTLKLLIDNYAEKLRGCGRFLRFIQTNHFKLESNLINKYLNLMPTTDFNYYYGLTEASRATFINFRKHPKKIESVGKPSPNVRIKIINDKGKKIKPFQIGEICIKGKMVIDKYWKNPQASKRIKNGWIHTKDAGYLDKDGFLYFYGRVDDLINIGGEKVSPEEIEEVAKKIKGVKDAAAIGQKNRLLGETVKLYISVNKIFESKENILNIFRKNVESYKIPRTIEIVKEIPRTENGKLARTRLKD